MKKLFLKSLALIAMLMLSVNMWAQTSVYCSPVTNNTFTSENGDGSSIAFKWQTTVNGDVVINIISANGSTTNVKYRGGNGFQQAIGGFKVNGAAADAYFTFKKVNDTTCRLTKIADVPVGAVISYEGTLEWDSYVNDVFKNDGYRIGTTKMNEYVYGTHCYDLTAPTGVAVSATGYVSFNDVAGATGYFANIYDGAVLVSTQAITNGGLLQFITTKNSYSVKVIAAVGEFGSAESEAAAWTPEAGRVYGTSDVCEYTEDRNGGQMRRGDTQVGLTFNTDAEGNIILKIVPVNGTETAVFREQGIGGSSLESFDIIYGADFSQPTPASTYFTRPSGDVTGNTIILTRKSDVNLPYPCKLRYNGTNAFVWTATKDGVEQRPYYKPTTFDYTYGTTCQVKAGVPGNVSVSATGRVLHDNVAGATQYAARFKKDGAIVMQHDITSGEPINWVSTEDATYQVTVLAFDAQGNMFDESETYNWTVEAGKVFGKSVYCNTLMGKANNWPYSKNSQNSLVRFTWETNLNGDVVITISEGDGGIGDQGADRFRGNGMGDGGSFKINELPISTYFTAVPANDGTEYILRLTDPANRPANGSHIKYNAMVTYRTSTSYDCWPTLEFDYIYGTKCTSADAVAPVIDAFEAVSSTYTTINFHVAASDVDDEGTPQTITYSLAGDNDFVTTAIAPDAEGNFALEGLKKNVTYHFSLTVSDPAGNTASKNLEVALPYDTDFDWTEYATEATVWAGATEGTNTAIKACKDGADVRWGNYGEVSSQENNWWTIDLGAINEIRRVQIEFATARKFDLQATFDGKDKVEAGIATWFTVVSAPSGNFDSEDLNFAARCIRVQATTSDFMSIRRVHIYGSGWATTDAVAPTVTVTEESKTTNTATLKIVATDKDDAGVAHAVKSITISGDNGFTTIENAELDGEGNITLNGLKDNTTYTFHVVVTDRVGLTAEQDIEVRVAFNNVNLALASNGATAVAGGAETGHEAGKAIDGDAIDGATSYWGTYGVGNWETTNVLTLTLAASYNINRIAIKTGGFDGTNHDATLEYSANGSDWTEFHAFVPFEANHEYNLPVVVTAQYLRFKATKNGMISIKEFEVYGTGYDDGDTEKPVITAAALVGEATDESAVVSVEATDNIGVYGLRFVDEANEYNVTFDYVHGENLTLEGLAPGTTYHFNIHALDRAGNVSEAYALAPFTTVGNTNIPNTSAPAPKQNALDVLSIYSDSYVPAVKDGFSWDAFKGDGTSAATHLNIAGNNYTIYTVGGGNQVGIGTWTGGTAQLNGTDGHTVGDKTGLNISGYKFLHVDVWTTESWNLTITLNDPTLAENIQLHEGWNAIDLPITAFLAAHNGEGDNDIAQNLRWMKFTNAAGHTLAIDNIFFWNDMDVTLKQDESNAAKYTEFEARYVNATIDRPFFSGSLYTLCLPFDADEALCLEALGAGYKLEKLGEPYMKTDDMMYLPFEEVSFVEAGVPYLFTPNKDLDNLVFNGVVINSQENHPTGNRLCTMTGFVNPMVIPTNEAYYLGSDQYLHLNTSTGTTYGFRAYFNLNFPAGTPANARARIATRDQVATDLEDVEGNMEIQKIIRDGQLYIIREGKMYNVQGILVK